MSRRQVTPPETAMGAFVKRFGSGCAVLGAALVFALKQVDRTHVPSGVYDGLLFGAALLACFGNAIEVRVHGVTSSAAPPPRHPAPRKRPPVRAAATRDESRVDVPLGAPTFPAPASGPTVPAPRGPRRPRARRTPKSEAPE